MDNSSKNSSTWKKKRTFVCFLMTIETKKAFHETSARTTLLRCDDYFQQSKRFHYYLRVVYTMAKNVFFSNEYYVLFYVLCYCCCSCCFNRSTNASALVSGFGTFKEESASKVAEGEFFTSNPWTYLSPHNFSASSPCVLFSMFTRPTASSTRIGQISFPQQARVIGYQ